MGHHAYHHLHVARLAVPTVAVLRHVRTVTFEVRARQIVEHQFRLQVEQVSQPLVQGDLEVVFVEDQMIECAKPTHQLREGGLDSTLLFPDRLVSIVREITVQCLLLIIPRSVMATLTRRQLFRQAQLTRQLAIRVVIALALQQSLKLRQDGLQRISASKVRDNLLADLAVLADRGHHTHIFMYGAAGAGDFHCPEK